MTSTNTEKPIAKVDIALGNMQAHAVCYQRESDQKQEAQRQDLEGRSIINKAADWC